MWKERLYAALLVLIPGAVVMTLLKMAGMNDPQFYLYYSLGVYLAIPYALANRWEKNGKPPVTGAKIGKMLIINFLVIFVLPIVVIAITS